MSNRRTFSKSVRLSAYAASDGKCSICGVKIVGTAEYDHIVPFALSADSSKDNCQVLCRKCHRLKTSTQDVPRISKAARVFEKRAGAREPKGRPLPGTKRSGLRKRMDGTVERR